MVISGCSIEPVRQVQPPAPGVAANEPTDLAFAVSDEPDVGATTTDAAGAGPIQGEAGAFTVRADETAVGVYSGPDSLYTLLDTLEPGGNVLATGREIDADGTRWIEINWRETTAWSTANAFEPYNNS